MIERYVRKEMGEIWEIDNKYRKWLDVEIAILQAREKLGLIPQEVVQDALENGSFTAERINEIELEIEHDLLAFVTAVQENLDPKYAGEFHNGPTSYDIEEPATALMMMQSVDIIIKDIETLMDVIIFRAVEHKHTIEIGRTHSQHATPVTFGLKLLNWYDSLSHGLELVKQAKEAISCGKINGAVGIYGTLSPSVEEIACGILGVNTAKVSTQILGRERHAQMLTSLAIVAGIAQNIAEEVCILSQTEIGEVAEPREEGDKGSSVMFHKRNPKVSARVKGLAREMRAYALVSMENITTWSERDIDQSGSERIIIPDAFQLLDYMLAKLTWVIKGLEVFPKRMLENLEMTYGVIASPQIKSLLLSKGVEPDKAYRLGQRASFMALEQKKHIKEVLMEWGETAYFFETTEDKYQLDLCFDWGRQLKHIDTIFARFVIKSKSKDEKN